MGKRRNSRTPRKRESRKMASKRGTSLRTSRVPKSPNIIKDVKTTIEGRPTIIRIYKKNWKYKGLYVATVHVGKTEMHYKRPRLGKKKTSRSRR